MARRKNEGVNMEGQGYIQIDKENWTNIFLKSRSSNYLLNKT